MDDLESLLTARASQGAIDPLDAMLAARANPNAPSPPSSKPIRPMEPPSSMDKILGKLPDMPGWLAERGGALGRLMMGAADPGIGLAQIVMNATGNGDAANQRIKDVEAQYQASRQGQGSSGFDPLRMAGNVGISLMAPGATAAPAPSLLANVLRGGATGAAFNVAQPVTDGGDGFWTDKAKQAGTGAAFGAAAVPVSSMVASMVRPNTSAAAQKLMDEGINLTPGQILGGGWHRAEDAATSIPVLGDFIRDAKNRTLSDFNKAAYSRALAPIGADASKLPVGPEGIGAVKRALSDAYEALLPKLSFKGDAQFVGDLNKLEQMAATLPDKEATQFRAILEKNLGQATPTGRMDGQTFKTVESSLVNEAKKFSGSTDGYQKSLGDALNEAVGVFRGALTRSNPKYADELQKINEGYANYARLRGAAASAGDKSHGFTPDQLAGAIRNQDKSAGKGATATGTALMQDLSDAARGIIPAQVADSGTPLRHAIQAAVGGLVGHSVLPESMSQLMVPAAGAIGGLALPYTQIGQKLAQKVLVERPEFAATLAQLLRRSGPLLGAAAAPALANGS